MRILVVEDDRKVAGFMQSGLQQEGHAVDVLNDGTVAGDQACAAGRAHECTLRVADLEMDTMRRTVRRGGRAIDWDIHFDSISNVIEVRINSLRQKIDRRAGSPF